MEYGKKLNPEYSLRTTKGIKGIRQKVIINHNPSAIDQNQLLLVRFGDLGRDDVIIPGTAKLSFDIELSSNVDVKRTLVSNIGRAIVKKLAVKFEGNEVLSIDDFDIFACYQGLFMFMDAQLNIENLSLQSTKNVYERTTYCIVRCSNWSKKNAFSIEVA